MYSYLVNYLVNQVHLVLLWVLSLWVPCPLYHPGHLWGGKVIITNGKHIIKVTIFSCV